jgi:epsilon-lactone hydrolase
MPCLQLYAGDHDPRDPYLSPRYADLTDGLPATILSSGTRDPLLSTPCGSTAHRVGA